MEGAQKNINNQLGTQLESLSAQIEAGIESGKYTLADIKQMLREKSSRAAGVVRERATQAATATNTYVRENAWKSMLVGGALGLICGLMTRECLRD